MHNRWHGLTPFGRAVHQYILKTFLRRSKPPSLSEITTGLDCANPETLASLADLCNRDLILMSKDQITGAYPFSARKSRHSVRIGEQVIPAICAIDALGAGAMAGRNSTVHSTCPVCERDITVETRHGGAEVANASPVSAVIWASVLETGGCAANTQCQTMLAFCKPEHLQKWIAETNMAKGFELTLEQAIQAGSAIFRPFLDR